MHWAAAIRHGLTTWLDRRSAMRELREHQTGDEAAASLDENNPVNRTQRALAAGNEELARQLWEIALTQHPDVVKAIPDAFRISMQLERWDEAKELLQAWEKRFRSDPDLAGGYALIAERRGDLVDAARLWDQVRRNFPHHGPAYVHASSCLRGAERLDEADALSRRAISALPGDQRVFREWARVAEARGDWSEAADRWKIVFEKFGNVLDEISAVRALTKLGRLEEAEQRLLAVRQQQPDANILQLFVGLARIAGRRGNAEAALERWKEVRYRFPRMPEGHRESIRYLQDLGRADEAEEALAKAINLLPEEAWPSVEYAMVATSRSDWAVAADRWAAVRTRWPQRADGYRRGAEALAALGRSEEAAQLRRKHSATV